MRKGPNYQDGGRGRGGRRDTNQQHVQTTGIRFEDPKPAEQKPKPTEPKPTPRQTEQERQDTIHQFKLKINPGIMRKKGITTPEIIEVIGRTIFTKTSNKAVIYPTTKMPLPPKPIKNISTQFPPSIAKLRDFFHVHEINERSAEIHLAFTMPGTTEDALHASMKNTLKQYSLWLTSKELLAKQQVWIGWIKYGNPTYTNPQGQATRIQEEITKMAEVNPAAAKQFAKIKGEQYIYCRPGKMFGHNAVSGEGISIFTTSNNTCLECFVKTQYPHTIK